MALIKDGQLVNDPFVVTPDAEGTLPDGRAVIVSLEHWQANRSSLIAHNGMVGIRLASNQPADMIANDLKYLAVVAIEFPTFNDGRGFSTARALRERYGYTGEIRAVGHLIRDQYLFLQRCGFNAVEVSDTDGIQEWGKAMGEFTLFYQTAVDDRHPIMSLRHRVEAAAE